MLKKRRFLFGIALSLIGVAWMVVYSVNLPSKELSQNELSKIVREKSVTSASLTPTLYPNFYVIEGKRREAGKDLEFSTTGRLESEEIKALLENPEVKILVPGKGMKSQMITLIPTVVIGGLIAGMFYFQMSVGKTKKNHKMKERPTTRFADVAGIDEAKSEIWEVVDFLKNPKKYKSLGGRLPKGVLLVGPPGTGKTLLARAIAGEADANFFSAHGSDFNEVFVGVGAKRIREIFQQAARSKPAIIFIDEIDCLGKSRKMDSHGEMQQTNNALLAAMDGFEACDGIVVIAATNRPEDLDEALTRPGRFDRKVYVGLPDMKGRRGILAVHAKEKPIEDLERTLDMLAQTTCEMSGADLAGILNEAAILCAQSNGKVITRQQLEESRDKVRWGKERKSMVLNKDEREMVAYHEAGHTIVNLKKSLLPPLYKVSIIPRGAALGVTTLLPNEDQNIHSKTFLLEELSVLMGGRAAEKVFYSATTNGAHGDLDTAKKIARSMIHEWGMGKKLYYQPERSESEEEINRLLESADKDAFDIIQAEKENTHKLAQALLKFETLTRDQVVDLLYENITPGKAITVSLN